MTKRPKNLDLNQLAKRILDEATGEEPTEPTPEERSEIAKLAAESRWKKSN